MDYYLCQDNFIRKSALEIVPAQYRPTFATYGLLLLLGIALPLLSFYFIDSQLELADQITNPILEVYLPTMAIQLITLLMIFLAVRSESVSPSDIGFCSFGRWTIFIAVLFFFAANGVLIFLQALITSGSPESFNEFSGLLPHNTGQKFLWLFLSLIVAISEEAAYRGYLISRISRLAGGRVWVGIVVASLAFASGHLYQGIGGMALIFIYGLMFSALYVKTGSLYPCIIAHFIQDAIVLALPEFA